MCSSETAERLCAAVQTHGCLTVLFSAPTAGNMCCWGAATPPPARLTCCRTHPLSPTLRSCPVGTRENNQKTKNPVKVTKWKCPKLLTLWWDDSSLTAALHRNLVLQKNQELLKPEQFLCKKKKTVQTGTIRPNV